MSITEALQSAATSTARSTTEKKEVPARVVQFIQEVKKAETRITYNCLAAILVEEGVLTQSRLMAMHAGNLVSSLPEELQPHVCNAKGKYRGDRWDLNTPFISDVKSVLALYKQM
jgi:phage tail tape-measure protein